MNKYFQKKFVNVLLIIFVLIISSKVLGYVDNNLPWTPSDDQIEASKIITEESNYELKGPQKPIILYIIIIGFIVLIVLLLIIILLIKKRNKKVVDYEYIKNKYYRK